MTIHWASRIRNENLKWVEIRCGYPVVGDEKRILRFPWRGYEVKKITHPEFGAEPVEVFAIKLHVDAVIYAHTNSTSRATR